MPPSKKKQRTGQANMCSATSPSTPTPSLPTPFPPPTTFPRFRDLPTELRLKIWGFATPDPCVVVQAESFHPTRRFRYLRDGGRVPAVLHACQESRAEFLDTQSGPVRNHPIYKLSFYGPGHRLARPVYFSAEQDIFWVDWNGFGASPAVQNLANLGEVSSELKHLVFSVQNNFKRVMEIFPKLETVTSLLSAVNYRGSEFNMAPEVGGQLDVSKLRGDELDSVDWFWGRVEEMQAFEYFKKKFPEKRVPVHKLRFRDQFIQNEGIQFPTRPADPLDEAEEGSG